MDLSVCPVLPVSRTLTGIPLGLEGWEHGAGSSVNARLDWDLGSSEARSEPWAICHVPRTIPEWIIPWQGGVWSHHGARVMSYNVYTGYIYQRKIHMNARMKNFPEEQWIHFPLSVVLTEIHLLLLIKPLQTEEIWPFSWISDINEKKKICIKLLVLMFLLKWSQNWLCQISHQKSLNYEKHSHLQNYSQYNYIISKWMSFTGNTFILTG